MAVGNKGLGAIENIMITIQHSGGVGALKIRTGARLGHGNRGNQFAGNTQRQILFLLLFAAITNDVRHGNIIVQRPAKACATGAANLFIDDAVIAKIGS